MYRGSMIEGGSETTSQALNNTFLGLLSNPDAIKKAQKELDEVVGSDRAPTLEDEPNLPYVRAILKVGLFEETFLIEGNAKMAPQQQSWTKQDGD